MQRKKLANVTFLVFDNFDYGCEMTISIAEEKVGPYIDSKKDIIKVYKNKFFCRSKEKRISIGSLPTRFIKIKCSKGVHLNLNNLKIWGFYPEDSDEIFGEDTTNILFNMPLKIIYT